MDHQYRLIDLFAGAGGLTLGFTDGRFGGGFECVLGVDNDEILCTLARPQLSSVVPDPGGIGYLAAQTLHELLQGHTLRTIQHWVRPLSVCSRQSTDVAAVNDWHVSQALRIILGQATRDLHVEDVVAQTGTSRRYLEERFRAVTAKGTGPGTTPARRTWRRTVAHSTRRATWSSSTTTGG